MNIKPCLPLLALSQGWTSTAWLVANTELTPRHGSPVFTAAIAHFVACGILSALALVNNHYNFTVGDGSAAKLRAAAHAVPRKLAFLGGLGWTSTVVMVAASPVLGIALAQVLVVSGELLTAAVIDVCVDTHSIVSLTQIVLIGFLVIAGVSISVLDELNDNGVSSLAMLKWALAAFGCGSCLVLNSLSNTHTRKFIGAINSSAWSAFVASVGNAVIWIIVEISGIAHFHRAFGTSTCLLWIIVGVTSSWMVFVVTFVPDRIGFALTFCLIVAGKMSGGLFADSVGLSGKRRPVTLFRIVGVLTVFVSAVLFKVQKWSAQHYAHLEDESTADIPATLTGRTVDSPTSKAETEE